MPISPQQILFQCDPDCPILKEGSRLNKTKDGFIMPFNVSSPSHEVRLAEAKAHGLVPSYESGIPGQRSGVCLYWFFNGAKKPWEIKGPHGECYLRPIRLVTPTSPGSSPELG
ncbi:hypothetical protein A3D03_01715 [Candidatus Gottesmanbacteria bacterium RIFCSPHIGHO2_02_FULL_40_13]|uniref:Uncharacterized protein n=1 Tax=Candidatus Gottesmanbacteria bacterium RIFCSPHIGHO2_02_FULL_40_13 TaxID=1798384 RepID=A0A1F6A740_9BACT|nr:MAG: hypothetical protein A3D03_01715 [Candidatus Gottesmanbacteria bacterium RIFCSPHIGHO2_02_FULL_40_13]